MQAIFFASRTMQLAMDVDTRTYNETEHAPAFILFLIASIVSILLLITLIVLFIVHKKKTGKCLGCKGELKKKKGDLYCKKCKATFVPRFPGRLVGITEVVKKENPSAKEYRIQKMKSRQRLFSLGTTLLILILIVLIVSPGLSITYNKIDKLNAFNDSPFDIDFNVKDDYVYIGSYLNVTMNITNNWDQAIPSPDYEFILYVAEKNEVMFFLSYDFEAHDPIAAQGPGFSIQPEETARIGYIHNLSQGEDKDKEEDCYIFMEVHKVHSRSNDGKVTSYDLVFRDKRSINLF
jgi:hypothetical protein